MKRILFACVLAASVLAPTAAYALDYNVVGKITLVESSYMPGGVAFKTDATVGNCGPGNYIVFEGQGADATSRAISSEAAFVLLLTAKATGQPVLMVGTNGTNGVCHVQYLSLT